MIVNSTNEPKVVDDYDFLFSTGLVYPVTVDRAAGDTVEIDGDSLATIFKLVEKPSLSNPETRIPAEEITIFMSHVLSITHRTRAVVIPTTEQKEQFQKTLHQLSKTIQ